MVDEIFLGEPKSLHAKVKENSYPENIAKRDALLREPPIYPDIKSVLGDSFHSRFEKRTPVEEPSDIHPALAELIAKNPDLKIDSMKKEDCSVDLYVISSKINDYLNAVAFVSPQIHHQGRRVSLLEEGGIFNNQTYDYFMTNKILVVNKEGRAISLDESTPYNLLYQERREREIRFVIDNGLINQSLDIHGMIATQPLNSIKDLNSFLNEIGHIWQAYTVAVVTKYSSERDAAAFAIAFTRALKGKEFLTDQEVKEIIDKENINLRGYQQQFERELPRLHSPRTFGLQNTLASIPGFTKKGVQYSRFVEMQKRKPVEERKKQTPRFEALIRSWKELVPDAIEKGLELQRKYRPVPEKGSFGSPKPNFLQTENGLFKISFDSGQLTLFRYSSADGNKIDVTEYNVSPSVVSVDKASYSKRENGTDYYDRSPKVDSLVLSENEYELGKDIDLLAKARETVADFFDCAEKEEIKAIPGQMRDLFEIMNPNKNQPEPEKVPA